MYKVLAVMIGMCVSAAWAGPLKKPIYDDHRCDPRCAQMKNTDASWNTYCRDCKSKSASLPTCKLIFSGTQPTLSGPGSSYAFKLKGEQTISAKFAAPGGNVTVDVSSVRIQDLHHPGSNKAPHGVSATADGVKGKMNGKFFSVTLTAYSACGPSSFTVDGR